MKSCLFLSNLSVVDHAYIDEFGNVVGGSFNPSFLVSGETDEVEKVVVDFSTVKKEMKALIDHRDTGFDHKLWILSNSDCTVQEGHTEMPKVSITTPRMRLSMPQDSVRLIPNSAYNTAAIGKELEEYLTDKMKPKYPTIKVQCFNTTEMHTLNNRIAPDTFTYTHGLRDSTSWGCQNIAHGHLSYIQLFMHPSQLLPYESDEDYRSSCPTNTESVKVLQSYIAAALDGTVFIRADNVKGSDALQLYVSYKSRDRGTFSAVYDRSLIKSVILETETTIEFLADYVVSRSYQELKDAGVWALAISEGLTKGSFIEI